MDLFLLEHTMGIHPYLGLGFGVLCLSWAAILIRLADAPPLVIASHRLVMACAILLPIALVRSRREIINLDRESWMLAGLSGIMLAIHFAGWITSLEYTSVASSVVLVTTYPIFVGLVSHWFLGDRLTGAMTLGIVAAIGGGLAIGYGDFHASGNRVYGDGLALIGAMSGAAYFLIGRKARGRVSLLTYITIVYSSAAVVLVLLALADGAPMTGYSWTTYGLIFAMALGPQLLGHTALNWTLKYLSAIFVSVSTLAEPVISTALAVVILNEEVTMGRFAGCLFVLAGIYTVLTQGKAVDQH